MGPAPTVTTLNIGRLRFDLEKHYGLPAGHPYAGRVDEIAILCFHLALPGRSVLVDAATSDLPPGYAEFLLPGAQPPPLAEQLAAAGADPAAVTDVVITHPHFDHITGLTLRSGAGYRPAFPNARHYLGAADWDPEHFDELERNTLAVIERAGLLNLVRGPLPLMDGLDIVPAPGETPGHQLLHLHVPHVDGAEAYFAGDLYHHPLEFDEPDRNVTWAEPKTMRASKEQLMARAAESGARVYFTHIEGAWEVRGGRWAVGSKQ